MGAEIVIGDDAEDGQRLIEHLAMLSGHDDADAELVRARLHQANHGSEFNRFGAGAENEEGVDHVVTKLPRHGKRLGERLPAARFR